MSGYKGYKKSDNVRRKMNNTGEELSDIGPNRKAKSWSTKPGQLSAKNQAEELAVEQSHKNRSMPVRKLDPSKVESQALLNPKPKRKPKYKRPVVLMTDEEFDSLLLKLKSPNQGVTNE